MSEKNIEQQLTEVRSKSIEKIKQHLEKDFTEATKLALIKQVLYERERAEEKIIMA